MIFHFGLNRNTIAGQLAAGVLTATLLFAAMLGVNRLFVAEREQGGFDAFLLAPVDRTSMLVAKAAALFIYLVVLEVVAVPGVRAAAARPVAGPGCFGIESDSHSDELRAGGDRDARVGDRGPHAGARPDRPVIALPLLIPALIATARAAGPVLAVAQLGLTTWQVVGDPGSL